MAALLITRGQAIAQQQATQQIPVPQGSTSVQSIDKRWSVTFDSEVRYFDSTTKGATAGAGGTLNARQVQTPFGMAISARPSDDLKLDFGVRSGYIDIKQSNSNFTAQFSGLTDTSVTGSATYYGFTGFQPFVSMSANLPTGKTNIGVAAASAKPDPDVFQSPTFGEGTNLGPSVGVTIPLNQTTVLTLGAGHTIRGEFTRDGLGLGTGPGSGITEIINPGDVTTATATLGYVSGPLSMLGQVAYSWETVTTLDTAAFFKSGDRVVVSGAIGYAWTDQLSSRLSSSFSHFEKNEMQNSPPIPSVYGAEAFNSNSNVINVMFDTTYKVGAMAVGPTASFMYRDHNGYDPTSFQFVPAKTKWSAGGVVQFAVANQVSFTMRAERIWVEVNSTPDRINPFLLVVTAGSGTPQLNTDAWLLSFGGTVKF